MEKLRAVSGLEVTQLISSRTGVKAQGCFLSVPKAHLFSSEAKPNSCSEFVIQFTQMLKDV